VPPCRVSALKRSETSRCLMGAKTGTLTRKLSKPAQSGIPQQSLVRTNRWMSCADGQPILGQSAGLQRERANRGGDVGLLPKVSLSGRWFGQHQRRRLFQQGKSVPAPRGTGRCRGRLFDFGKWSQPEGEQSRGVRRRLAGYRQAALRATEESACVDGACADGRSD